jgi:hypothetical protein
MSEIKYDALKKALEENELFWGMSYCKNYCFTLKSFKLIESPGT